MHTRKDTEGRATEYSKRVAIPRLMALEPDTAVPAYLQSEQIALDTLKQTTDESDLKLRS